MFNPKKIGRRVRRAREAAGLKQEDLALAAGVRAQAISNLESQGTDAKSSTIVGIAKACNVTVSWLLTGEDGKQSPSFIRFVKTSPLGQSTTQEERRLLSAAPFPPERPPPTSLYEKWLIDLRQEWKQAK